MNLNGGIERVGVNEVNLSRPPGREAMLGSLVIVHICVGKIKLRNAIVPFSLEVGVGGLYAGITRVDHSHKPGVILGGSSISPGSADIDIGTAEKIEVGSAADIKAAVGGSGNIPGKDKILGRKGQPI